MTVKVRITDDWSMFGIQLVFVEENDGHRVVGNLTERQLIYPNAPVTSEIEPVRMTDDQARALLSALSRHYEGGEDTRSLRKDYDAERQRVDTFIAYLTKPAKP